MCPIPSNSLNVINFKKYVSVILCEFCFPDMLLRSVKLWLSVIFCIGVVAFFWPRLPKENVLNIMFPIAEHWKNMREFPQL